MCWPLKLTAFERYMWCDSRPANPMTHFVVLRCSGPFDEAAFRTAVARAVDRHPLLRARIEGLENGPAHWVRAPAAPPDCNVAGADEPLRLTGTEELDLRRETGFRAWVRGAAGAVVIRLQFHHACCDGVAATRFIDDILVGYDHLVRRGTGDPPWPPLAARGVGKSVQYQRSTSGDSTASMGARSLSAIAPNTAWVVG